MESDLYSIEHILKSVKKTKFPQKGKKRNKVFKFKTGNIALKLRLPSIEHDTYVNQYFISQVAPMFNKSKAKIKQHVEKILSQTYFIELCKYIDVLEVTKGQTETRFHFDNIDTLTQQLKLLEKLPTDIVVEINEYIRNLKEIKDSMLYYIDNTGRQVPLTVDVNLFTTI